MKFKIGDTIKEKNFPFAKAFVVAADEWFNSYYLEVLPININSNSTGQVYTQTEVEVNWELDGGLVANHSSSASPLIGDVSASGTYTWKRAGDKLDINFTPEQKDECKAGGRHNWKPSRTEGHDSWCSGCGEYK